MRHSKKTVKLGRSQSHRDALLSNQVCSLVKHGRIKTTLAKAKAVKPLAERMLTLGKKGDLHARRTALSYLKDKDVVKKLFGEIAPASADRKGGYTRITKLGARLSDSAPMAYLAWVDFVPADTSAEAEPEAAVEVPAEKSKKKASSKKAKEATDEKAAE